MVHRLRLTLLLLALLACPAVAVQPVGHEPQADAALAAVYRIQAVGGRHVTDGSAVLIAPGRLVTACHVTRDADSIRVGRDDLKWVANPAVADIEHDLCVLAVSELVTAVPAAIGTTEDLRLGDAVIAAGYPRGGKRAVSHGEIKGLHPLDGASVIQVSARFEHGQSGGALLDAAGRLIGVIGFKAGAGGDFNYALPLAWALDAIHGRAGVPTLHDLNEQAFWERPDPEKPVFLRAASLEANQDWNALYGVAQQWVATDRDNPASWLCLARILTKLKRDQAAATAFEKAKALLRPTSEKSAPAVQPVRAAEFPFASVGLARPFR